MKKPEYIRQTKPLSVEETNHGRILVSMDSVNYGGGYVVYSDLIHMAVDSMILCNHLLANFFEDIEFELQEDVDLDDILQTYIVDRYTYDALSRYGQSVGYIPDLDLYLWFIDFYGASWENTPTNIKLERSLEEITQALNGPQGPAIDAWIDAKNL